MRIMIILSIKILFPPRNIRSTIPEVLKVNENFNWIVDGAGLEPAMFLCDGFTVRYPRH